MNAYVCGFIPYTLGNLISLDKQEMNGNYLSGVIPREILLCTKLQYLDLNSNKLTGGIPFEIGSIKGLDIAMNISWNYLLGTIPLKFSRLIKMEALDIVLQDKVALSNQCQKSEH